MSPSAAFTSPVFQFYLAIAAGLLIGAGALLAVLRWGLGKDVEHAWKAYRGWLIMVPLLLGVIFLGRETTIVFFTIVAIFGFKEFARATGLYRDWFMTGAVHLGIIAAGVLSLVAEGHPNKIIADRLRISEHTAKFHINTIFAKLGATSRTEAVVRAVRQGLLTL